MPSDNGWPYRFELIELDRLYVDPDYQRPLSSFSRQIRDRYNPALVGTLIASEHKGRGRSASTFAVVDGQTRLYGMRANDEPVAPCLVYVGLTQKQEAQLFAALQTQRRGMATYLRFRAALIAGDAEASAIAGLVQQTGLKVAGDGDNSGIRSIAALEWLFRRDPNLLLVVLNTIQAAWPTYGPPAGTQMQDQRTRSEILRGIGRFIIEREPDLDRLVEKLRRMSPEQLRHRANALREGSGSSGNWDMYVRDALTGVYGGRK